jgi:glycosyltransferase involved in cell wall biosynthesis
MNKLKILITLNNSWISGIENYVLTIVKYLGGDNVKFVVAIPDHGQIENELKKLNVEYFVFNPHSSKPYSIKGILNLAKYLIENKFDVIHAQAGIVPCILGYLLGVKMCLEHKHGLDFTEKERKNMNLGKRFYESFKKHFVDYTFTGCERDRLFLINYFNYKPEKVITIYNGVEDYDSNEVADNPEDCIRIGTICRLSFQKAPEVIIELAKVLKQSGNGKKYIFDIWGDGELRVELLDLIKSYNLEDNVFLKGYAYNLKEVYSSFDLFVLTSRYEGIPYVILKAMSAKVPVVATEVGGINEVIKNNYNGLLVQFGDLDALVKSVKDIMNDSNLRRTLVENAYLDFQNKWTIDKTVSKVKDIYLENLS